MGGCLKPDPLSQTSFTHFGGRSPWGGRGGGGGGFMRGAEYTSFGVGTAERTPSGLDDTEPRLLNLIDRRKQMARRLSTWSRGNWSKLPPDLSSRLSKGRKAGFYRRSTWLESRTTGLWSIRIEEKSLSVGFRRRKISCYSRPRTLRGETMVLSSRSRTFKRGKVSEIEIRYLLRSGRVNTKPWSLKQRDQARANVRHSHCYI